MSPVTPASPRCAPQTVNQTAQAITSSEASQQVSRPAKKEKPGGADRRAMLVVCTTADGHGPPRKRRRKGDRSGARGVTNLAMGGTILDTITMPRKKSIRVE